MLIVFWCACALVGYTYVGYPLGIWLLSLLRPADERKANDPTEWPAVSVVIAVHNEAARIDRKLKNLAELDYPPDRLHVLFVCDGCTDDTAQRLQGNDNVQVLVGERRRGKPAALNQAVAQVTTPLIVFMDVRQRVEPGALKLLVARLLQDGIAAVSGELCHLDPATRTAASIGLYWRYEKWIRKSESRFDSTVGSTGAMYAMRTRDYLVLPEDTILDDFVIPMHVVRTGRRVVLHEDVPLEDELQAKVAGERKRKIRTLTGNFQAFARYPWMFSPRSNRLFVQFVSHKVLRLLVPYALIAVLVSSALLEGLFYRSVALGQVLFYALALAGAWWPALRSIRLVSFASVFTELNLAAVLALVQFLFRPTHARWERT